MSNPVKVLLVEDVESDAEFVTRALLRGGLDIVTRRVESEEALRAELEGFAPDIVLSDFSLPGFDGVRALDVVREMRPHLPFVFVSGTLGEDRAIEALKRGATDYVLKSNLSRLEPAVRRALAEGEREQARLDAEEALRTSEQRLRDIVQSSQDWIWESDADGSITFSNRATTSILGYEPQELIGRRFADLLTGGDASLVPSEARPSINGVTARWRHKDGSTRWLERSATLRLDAHGQVLGFRGTERDVTQRLAHENRIARLNRVHTLLSSVNATVARASDRARLLQDVCKLAVERGGYLRTIVSLVNAGTYTVRPVAWDSRLDEPLRTLTLPLAGAAKDGISLTAQALETLQPAVCDRLLPPGSLPADRDVRARVAVRHGADLYALGVRAMAVLPMVIENKAIGTLTFEAAESDVFDTEELALLSDVAADVGFSMQYFQQEDAVHFLSWFDPLTQLARRELFCERLGRILESTHADGAAAVLIVDLERIGFLNDTLGRDTGDQLLRAAAQRLKTQLGNPDRLAHLGAGVYAVAFSGLDGAAADIDRAREEVRGVFDKPFQLGEREIDVSVRTGLAYFPKDGDSAHVLLQNAEAALRHAKETEAGDFEYTITINSQLAERMLVGQKLNRALDQRQFLLHYQPLVDVATGRIVSAEALIRWADPDRGLVPPGQFISMLEQTGQIIEVGQWVFEQVARDAARLRNAGVEGMRIGVNISPLQLRRSDFVDRIVETVTDNDQNDPGLEIEITESMLMQDLDISIEKLGLLRQAGIRISIDDFGTGYSSLALLARLPIDCLKIDRSFINRLAEDPASMTVVSTIIGLARSFRLSAAAEGVETEEQLKLLRLMKCDLAQGFLFGHPMGVEDLLETITSGATSRIPRLG